MSAAERWSIKIVTEKNMTEVTDQGQGAFLNNHSMWFIEKKNAFKSLVTAVTRTILSQIASSSMVNAFTNAARTN